VSDCYSNAVLDNSPDDTEAEGLLDPEDEDTTIHRTVGDYLTINTTKLPVRHDSSKSLFL
jgi:hypothetical protein